MVKPAPRRRLTKEEQKQRLEEEIEFLKTRVIEEAPDSGYAPPLSQRVAFSTLPLSEFTQKGLLEAKYTTMTAIQNACIPHALAGRDILGAANTGSGKTLAFLIPALECLFRNRFTPHDGPGAVILSPTRELAIQIFQVLQKVGKHHSFSVGLLIGGRKDFYQEQEQITATNIIIATPGRLLQHLEQTPNLDMNELCMLVADEADRILDLGFRDQLVRILDYLPAERQTLLFSATQTRDVSALATMSLRNPEYLGVHDKSEHSTPEALQQSYVIVPLEHKLNAIYSFIKSHLKYKSIIFMATCAQIRHANDLFCSIRPGVPILNLHGKLSQERRTQIYFDFCNKQHAVLFATDIAARGLDFPNVDWVVQVDAPEDENMYIHRAGRTARYRAGGKSLLILTENEHGFIDLLQKKKNSVPLKKLSINPNKATIVTERAASLVVSNVRLHELAKKAFQSYVRSIHLMPNKEIFNVDSLDLEGYSKSLGLASKPNLRFLEKAAADRAQLRENKNVNKKLQRLKEQIKAEKLAKNLQRMGNVEPANAKRPHDESSDDDEVDDLLVSKKKTAGQTLQDDDGDGEYLPDVKLYEVSKSRHSKTIRVDGSHGQNKRVVFNDDGEEEERALKTDGPCEMDAVAQASESYLEKVKARLASTKEQDEEEQKERIRQKHKKRRLEQKDGRLEEDTAPAGVSLGSAQDDGAQDDVSSSSDSKSAGDDESVSTSDSSVDGDEPDLKAQEDLALALIRGS